MHVKTNSTLPNNVMAEGLIKPNTLYKVLSVHTETLPITIDIVDESDFILLPEDCTVVTFKDYVKLCSK